MRRSLRTQLTTLFLAIAIIPLLVVAVIGIQQSIVTQIEQTVAQQNEVARRVSISVVEYILDAEDQLRVLVETSNIQQMDKKEAEQILLNMLNFSDVFEQIALVNADGEEIVKVSRSAIIGTESLKNIRNLPEYVKPFTTKSTYYSNLIFNEDSGEPYLTVAIPIVDLKTGNISNVLIANLRFKTVWALMGEASNENLTVYMTDLSDRVIAHPNASIALQGKQFNTPASGELGTGLNDESAALGVASVQLGESQTFFVIAELPTNVALASTIRFTVTSGVVLLLTIILTAIFSVWQTRQFSRPIEELAKTAQEIAQGNLSARVEIKSENEIGALGSAFNNMTERLRETLGSLEIRVEERTKALATVADIGTATSTILDVDKLLFAVVELSKERFNLYHSHIYLMDEAGENLVLAAGAGEPGRIMVSEKRSIPLSREQSLVARAARERKGVTINDVTQAPDFLPNPLLPDTRSELAVPMIVGNRILGVFDIQSEIAGRFTESDVNIQNTLAAQLAVSVQNARQVQQSIALAAELSGFRSAVNEAAIIAMTDVQGKIEFVNEQFIKISKYPREELIGQDHRILNSGYHPKEFIRDLWVTIANGKVWRNEIRNKAKDGSIYWVDTTIAPILNEQGKPVKYVAIRFDITQRKEFEMTTTRRAAQVQALDNITQKIQSADKIETALQVAARELGHALGMKPTKVTLKSEDKETPRKPL